MKYFYSLSTGGFFNDQIHGENIPLDAIEISPALYAELLSGINNGKRVVIGENEILVLDDQMLEPLPDRKLQAKNKIDAAAGNARQRFVSTGTLIDMEYKLAQEQTAAWRAAGSPANDVPSTITSWAAVTGMTDEEAATDIEATAIAWEQVLIGVRQIRLAGKAAIDAAADQGTASDMANVAKPFIDQLDALTP